MTQSMITKDVEFNGARKRIVSGSFETNFGTPEDLKGAGFTVANTATGVYQVTLTDKKFHSFIRTRANIWAATAVTTQYHVRGGDRSVANGTVDLVVESATDPSASDYIRADPTGTVRVEFEFELGLSDVAGSGN